MWRAIKIDLSPNQKSFLKVIDSGDQIKLDFPDYSSAKLREPEEHLRTAPDFANARKVRNLLDHVIMNQNLRTEDTDADMTIAIDDVEDYISDEGIELNDSPAKKMIDFV